MMALPGVTQGFRGPQSGCVPLGMARGRRHVRGTGQWREEMRKAVRSITGPDSQHALGLRPAGLGASRQQLWQLSLDSHSVGCLTYPHKSQYGEYPHRPSCTDGQTDAQGTLTIWLTSHLVASGPELIMGRVAHGLGRPKVRFRGSQNHKSWQCLSHVSRRLCKLSCD